MEDNFLETKAHIAIIGGGIFGISAAIILGENGYKVTLIEKNNDLLMESSLVNQNRIHYGYHYPRSLLTGVESLKGLNSFKEFYGQAIISNFQKYYAIARHNSHTTVDGFIEFCRELDLPLQEAWPSDQLLNKNSVNACWLTPEPVFDYHTMRQIALYRLHASKNVRVLRNAKPLRIETGVEKHITLNTGYKIKCDAIVNSAYSGIPEIAGLIGGKPIKAKSELCLMPILEMPNPPSRFGITVMDGPFCSLMPKGANSEHFILYHVTYSVLQTHFGFEKPEWSPFEGITEFELMEHSTQFFPIIREMKLRESWITTRVVLPEQELDDARPTLLIENAPDVYTIFSGKLTTCVDAARNLLIKLNSK
jgi:hypothetical protein